MPQSLFTPTGLLSALILLLGSLILPHASQAAKLADTIERIEGSVVAVGTFQYTRRPQARFSGTGFVVGDGFHVITNHHVLPKVVETLDKEYLAVFTGSGAQVRSLRASIVARDPEHDLALLKFDGRKIPPMRMANDRKVRAGDEIAFTGFPIGMVLGLHPVTHRGIVSAITPVIEPVYNSKQLNPKLIRRLRDPFTSFQLDATAYPGNSGSPVYKQGSGKLIGIVNKVFVKETRELVIQKPSGITYAIPIRYAKALLKKAGIKP